MNVETRGLLIGMTLGDGHIHNHKTRELRIVHSVSQSDYCEYKAMLIKNHLGGNFHVRYYDHRPPSLKGKSYRMCGFTATHPYFKQIRSWCYQNGKKQFTVNALRKLTPHGIAIWYMDDGHARVNIDKKGYITSVSTEISTFCSKWEIENVLSIMKHYGIGCKVRCDKNRIEGKQFYIQTNTEQSRKFVNLVKPYIIPSMLYKIKHVDRLNSHEHQIPLGNCLNCGKVIYDNRRRNMCVTCYTVQNKTEKTAKTNGNEIVRTCRNMELQEVQDKEPER